MLQCMNSPELVVESIAELIDPNMELLHWAQAVEYGKGIHCSALLMRYFAVIAVHVRRLPCMIADVALR
jgi:hypothetical protein